MKSLIVVSAFLMMVSGAFAQDVPKAEVWGGYSFWGFLGPDPEEYEVLGIDPPNSNGWTAGAVFNITPAFGLEIEGSGAYTGIDNVLDSAVDIKGSSYSFAGGPRFTARNEKVNPFVHALIGGGHTSAKAEEGAYSYNASGNYFGMVFGGGLDWNVGERISIKAPQVDFIPMRSNGEWGNFLRISTGVVFKIF